MFAATCAVFRLVQTIARSSLFFLHDVSATFARWCAGGRIDIGPDPSADARVGPAGCTRHHFPASQRGRARQGRWREADSRRNPVEFFIHFARAQPGDVFHQDTLETRRRTAPSLASSYSCSRHMVGGASDPRGGFCNQRVGTDASIARCSLCYAGHLAALARRHKLHSKKGAGARGGGASIAASRVDRGAWQGHTASGPRRSRCIRLPSCRHNRPLAVCSTSRIATKWRFKEHPLHRPRHPRPPLSHLSRPCPTASLPPTQIRLHLSNPLAHLGSHSNSP